MECSNNEKTVQDLMDEMSPRGQHVLEYLNGCKKEDLGNWKYDRYPRLLTRTSGRHYRMLPAMASLLDVEVVSPAGAHASYPPTVMVTVEQTLERLDSYIHTRPDELSYMDVLHGIHQAVLGRSER